MDVYFDNEGIHSLGADGELKLTIASAVAESESYEKSTNIRWGLQKSARKADSKMFSRICCGYSKDGNGELVIDEAQVEVVRMAFKMYRERAGVQRIKASEKMLSAPKSNS